MRNELTLEQWNRLAEEHNLLLGEVADLRAELAAEREMVVELKSWREVVGNQLLAEIRHSTNLQAERDALRALLLDAYNTWGEWPQETLASIADFLNKGGRDECP